jgi:hypothetical protein
MNIKQVKITNTQSGNVKYSELNDKQYDDLLKDRAKKDLPLKIAIVKEREL